MSSHSSGITGTATDLSDFILHQQQFSNLDMSSREYLSSDWTDEKHTMYLKSLEASFVDQLYSSIDSSASLTPKQRQSCMRSSQYSEFHPTNELKVHQNGSWKITTFNKGESPPQDTEECQFLQGFRAGIRKYRTVQGNTSHGCQNVNSGAKMLLTRGLTNILHHSPGRQPHQDSGVNQEFSDQNFEEDDKKEGTIGCLHATKRAKIANSS